MHGFPRLWLSTTPFLDMIATKLQSGGIYSVVVMRLLPVAPFTIVNLLAGTLGIRFSDFFIGSMIGLLPGMLSTLVLADRLLVVLQHFNWVNLAIVAAIATGCAITAVLLRRSVRRRYLSRLARESISRDSSRCCECSELF